MGILDDFIQNADSIICDYKLRKQGFDQAYSDLEQAKIQLAAKDVEIGEWKVQASKPKQRIGMNCGLFNSPSYSDVDKVINCLSQLNIKHIRVAFDYDPATGKMLVHDRWVNVCKPKLDAAGIHVRATVYLRGADGFDAFNKFYNNYPYFDEIEIGNENALRSLVSGSGTKAADYDQAKLQKDVDYITGAYKALLQYPVLPIISITWIHYYYNDLLRAAGVNAMLSVHSYSDGYDAVAAQYSFKGLNAITAAKSKYGSMVKEIGETNYMPPKTGGYTDQLQIDKFLPLFKKILDSGLDVYIFQLFDTPERAGREATFGLFRTDGTPKPIVAELQKFILLPLLQTIA